jgi:hypothetical protein
MKITVESSFMGGFNIKVRSDDSEAFREAIEALKSHVSPSMRAWQPAAKSWHVAGDGQDSMMAWFDYCRNELGAEVSWVKAKRQGKEGRTAPKPAPDPFAALYLLPSAPVEVVRAAYRALATIHHPDHGGDAERMKIINAAYSEATQRLAA